MEAYLETIADRQSKEYVNILIEKFKESPTKQCVIYIPFDNEYIVEHIKKVSRYLNPASKVSFTQDWDDEASIKVSMS